MVDEDGFARLLAVARTGNEEAITRIYRLEQPRLLRVLRAEVGDAADDVASQTWLEAMGALGTFEGGQRGFRALLFTIARRRVADHWRTQRRRPATPTAHVELHAAVDSRYAVESDVLAAVDSDEAVKAITDMLSAEQAEILLLRVVAGLSVEEVATIVGKSAGAVRVHQHRALKRLAEALEEEDR
jgi:RNA polymerase sigma-70 factor (ECF subfamily)